MNQAHDLVISKFDLAFVLITSLMMVTLDGSYDANAEAWTFFDVDEDLIGADSQGTDFDENDFAIPTQPQPQPQPQPKSQSQPQPQRQGLRQLRSHSHSQSQSQSQSQAMQWRSQAQSSQMGVGPRLNDFYVTPH